jgi:glycosyltransferase involved in cell wall biosynthesis
MSASPELAVIVPVYNEQDIIGKVVDDWLGTLDSLGVDYRIHVYNDGSRDGTSDVVRLRALKHDRVILHEKPNTGHGPTILQGYRENCGAEWLFQVDSDDEMAPGPFRELWARRMDFDFLCGRRVGYVQPLARRIVSFVSRVVVWSVYGNGVHDVNVPYRLMRSSALRSSFHDMPADTFAPNVILTGMACLKRLRIFEMPVTYRFRSTGEGSLNRLKLFKSACRSFLQTIVFRLRPGTSARPRGPDKSAR